MQPQIEGCNALTADVLAWMSVEIVIWPQKYALLLLCPRGAVAVDQAFPRGLDGVGRCGMRRARLDGTAALRGLAIGALHEWTVQARIQWLGVAGLGLLALPEPVNLAEGAENTGAVLETVGIRVEDAVRAGAGRNGVGRGEGVVWRRHGLEGRVVVETHSLNHGAWLEQGARVRAQRRRLCR